MARDRRVTPGGRLLAFAMIGSGRALARLPSWLVPRLGTWLSRCRPLLRRRERIAARNLAVAFPALDDAARARLLRDTLASNTTGGLDTLRAWFGSPGGLDDVADIAGLDVLVDAIAEGRGAILVGAHYDSVELAIRAMADAARARGVPMAIFLRHYNDPAMDAAIERGRLRYASTTIDKKDVSGLCRAVAAGAVAFYAPDQDAGAGRAFVPFFGVPAATSDAIPGVLARTGAALLLAWSRRGRDGRLAIDIERAPEGFFAGGGAEVAARYMAWVEHRVRAAPEQYLWVHRRYKTRPPGAPDVYGGAASR